ncbi:MAG TPA: alpha/beta hydrolase-fold protein [Flavobacterium sp.]|nr:alpha/beta hydrolase-fold protein [Flavobacterium sp.]
MKHLVLSVLCLFSVSAFSQRITDTIHSQKLGEDREIQINVPASYKQNPGKKYPLLVLLDGDYLMDPFEGALKYGAYWDDLPEMIIVGINQVKTREADCTVNADSGLPEEQGEKFFEFIGEVVGAIEKQYRISPFKIIAGHDVTAGFMNFYLYKDNPLFNAYISMSPELPKEMETRIPERLAVIPQHLFYYQSTADGDVKKMQIRIKALDEGAKKISKPELNYKFDEFKGASHYSLVLHSIPSALYQFFSVYQPISSAEFNEKIATLPSGYVDYLVNKYDVLEKVLGMKMAIRMSDFKAIEAAILKNKAYNEFDQLSDLARKSYPKSMLADYEMAMMYEKKEDLTRAVKSYMNAYQKEEIGDLTKDMMLNKADELKKQ